MKLASVLKCVNWAARAVCLELKERLSLIFWQDAGKEGI